MSINLICNNCKKSFTTRKRGERVIKFCSKKCSHEIMDEIKKQKWIDIHNEWKNEPRDIYIKAMRNSFEKFFNKTDGCWIWNGSKKSGKRPYGTFSFRFFNGIAHRASWIIYRGDIPENFLVLHSCDIPQCVNPDHLWLGSHLDNERDKILKGRGKGEKLNIDKVKEIKSLIKSNFGDTKIAKKYGVSYQTIWSIRIGRTWKDIL